MRSFAARGRSGRGRGKNFAGQVKAARAEAKVAAWYFRKIMGLADPPNWPGDCTLCRSRPSIQTAQLRWTLVIEAGLEFMLANAKSANGAYSPSKVCLCSKARLLNDLLELLADMVAERLRKRTGTARLELVVDTPRLTPREQSLVDRIARGCDDKIIAGELGLTVATVRCYNSRLFRKLGLPNRSAVAAWAVRRGLG